METTVETGKETRETLNFIPDRAAENDDFGSHKPLAKVIAGIIRNRSDLKVIGLLGPWGSGKSTVVKFVGEELVGLAEGDRILCFTYDAWLHQSDPPRRSFLDALIRFLIAEDLTTYAEWKDQLALLNRQIEDTDVTTTPTLSEAGKWLLPLALVVPFGMQFIGHDWFDAVWEQESSLLERLAFPAGIILTIAPALGAIGLWLKWRQNRNFLSAEFWKNPKTRRQAYRTQSLLSIFTNREIVKQSNRTIRTPDPTTIEFQKVFRDILSGVSEDRNKRPLRFIFVIDNLDRLPEAQAVEMWGTIRSFFLGSEAGVRLPTVILPIDEEAVKRMYGAQHSDAGIADALARSFMDKTFDLSFRVSRPVLSDWHQYIEKKLKFLFGDEYRRDWSSLVASMYDGWLIEGKNKEPVTPRQLNTLLNSIGALWLQWHGRAVSFASIAYYAIDREAIDRDILEYVMSRGGIIAPHDPNWQSAFAAMHFGVDVQSASQILLDRPIRAAISGNRAEEFSRLARSPGFAIAFDRIIESELSSQSPTIPVARAVLFVEDLGWGGEEAQALAWWKLRRLRNMRFDGKNISAVDAKSYEILLRDNNVDSLPRFITSTATSLSRIEDLALTQPPGRDAFKRILIAFGDAAARNSVVVPPVNLKLSPGTYLALLASVGGQLGLSRNLQSASSDDELRQVVVDTINVGSTQPPADQMVYALLLAGRNWDWTPVIDAASARFNEGFSAATVVATKVLGNLRVAAPQAQLRIDELVSNGTGLARFSEAYNANDTEGAAALAALVLVSKTPATLVAPDGLAWQKVIEARVKLAPEVGAQLFNFGINSLSQMAAIIANAGKATPLIRESAYGGISKKLLILPTAKEVASSYDTFWPAVPAVLDEIIITQAAQSEEFWEELTEVEFRSTNTAIGFLLDSENEFSGRAALFAKKELDKLSVESWASAIDDGEFPFDVAISSMKILGNKRLGGHLAEALQGRFEGLTKNVEGFRKRWFELLTLTTANAQKTILRNLRDYLATHSGCEAIPDLLAAGGDALIKGGELNQAADGIARNLIIPMVSTPDDLSWLQSRADDLKAVIKGAAEETRGVIGERLEMTSRAPEFRDAAEALRSAWTLAPFAVEEVEQVADAATGSVSSGAAIDP